MATERTLTRQVVAHLKARQQRGEPIWWLKVHGHHAQRAGVPDLVICHRGQALFIELKAPGGRLTRLQEHAASQIRQAGGRVLVAETCEEVGSFLGDMQ